MEARFRPCQDTLSLLEALQGCWRQSPTGPEHAKPFFVGITLRNLIPEADLQATLFEEPGNRNQLSATMDKLNLKYGHTTLHFAGMLPARDSAPTRIAFTQSPGQDGNAYLSPPPGSALYLRVLHIEDQQVHPDTRSLSRRPQQRMLSSPPEPQKTPNPP
jgi:hypothetical protein